MGRVPGAGDLLEVTCRVEDEIVSKATCRLAAPVTAYVYPGQGVQTPGMGLDEANSSKAAREIWDRADRHTRRKLGFSILTVVRDNPTELTALGTTYRHPKGLLHLTQFTQVALATLAFAQTARLEEAGMLASGAYFAGHSLGEYTALSAYAGVFDLETVLEIVFHRGSTMHHLVPRDESGRSNYALGALRPELFGVGDADVDQYVAEVAERSGEFLEVVNRNLAGAQYSIAGTVAGLAALEKDASRRVKSGKKPFQLIPGIDVPFHSAVLRGGVGEFREHLETLLPADICPAVLVGKYIPNLTASAFSLERSFLEDIVAVAPSEPVQALLDSDELYAKALEDPTKFARMLLIELLAWQFASPVRWIETQELLLKHERVEEYIEVGLGSAPTLANLAARTLLQPQMRGCEATVLNVQRDEARVYATDTDPAEETLGAPVREEETVSAPVAETVVETAPEPRPAAEPAPVKASAPAGETPELPYTAGDAVRTLLAMTTKVRPEQMGSADTIETLTGGVSSRRNQLLMDMSAELGLASIEGASDMALGALTEKVDSLADTYQPFGAVLSGAIRERLRRVFGAAGVDQTRVGERLKSAWGLGEGWTAHVTSELMLGTREGDSARGGALAQLGTTAVANAGAADQLIDAAVEAVASAKGIAVSKAATTSSQGAMVDNAALGQLADQVLGGEGVLAEMARDILNRLGIQEKQSEQESTQAETESVLATVEAELGSNWIKYVAPAFKAEQALLIDDRWALAREDLARVYLDENEEVGSFTGLGETIAQQARWWAGKAKKEKRKAAAERLEALAEEAETPCEGQFANDVAVVTGGAPGSIAAAIIGGLLKGGATVVATASHINHRRLDWAKDLYRKNASAGAKLWLVPANLASYRDVDDTVEWIGSPYFETNGGVSEEVKPALIPSLFFPFAAPSVSGTLDDAGPEQENQARLLLWSLERSMAGLSKIGIDNDIAHRLHVVLPGSPNRGTFGGDGAYGEVKSALDAIINRWHAENDWSAHTTLVHPKIGWVRGTGLMGRNDPLVKAVEATGVRTYSTVEIADELLALCAADKRKEAETEPLIADLTGGLSKVNLTELMGQARAAMGRTEKAESVEPETIAALPTPQAAQLAAPAEWGKVSTKLEDMVVVVGIGEVGPWGSERTRHEAELGLRSDSGADLTPAGVLELAWMTGLLTWKDTPEPGWYSEAGKLVPESEIFETYRDEVVARSGVRSFVDDGPLFDLSTEQDVQVFLDKDISFKVPDAETAAMYAEFDPEHTHVAEAGGEYLVTRTAGAVARLPRKMPLTRTVGGQFPTGYDPTHWGIPGSMVEAIDKIAVWHLVATVDAFVSSGFSPAELLTEVHPADVAATLGTGFGGMSSMRKLFVDGFNGEDIPNDILQETLPNVVGGHVIQSYVGSYGPMMHPVAACATAAVSIEDAADKILVGKADFVVAGAIDDIGVESIRGFGDMNATVSAAYMREHGVDERFYSRANDRRRHGFVESQGGGTVLLTRGDIALRLGLPVLGVVAYARSSADGAHTSIPAPGLGALSAGRGGKDSKMAKALAGLGVSVDDIAVVSKHDTSTLANDPNEADLHTRLAHVLGRTPGDPLFVISQKTVTGHAKGGAAVFQAAGLCEAFATGSIPGNKALDCVDPAMEAYPELVWPRSAIELGKHSPIKAGLLTSLGFGHVSALIAMVHPAAFEEAVRSEHGAKELAKWRERAQGRLTKGARKREFAMIGRENLFEPVQSRRFAPAAVGYDPHEVEAELLLDSSKRLGEDGYYA
ncbi:MAG: acyltransferase domain-containing protein [Propionibacteriaceae bacterium]|nr:acyltransferase domain-containing protein [Propionibacteriaceae bacterium]